MPRPSGKSNGRSRGGRPADHGESRETTISKAVSFVLRHGAGKEGLKLDERGYANAQDLVSVDFFFHLFVLCKKKKDRKGDKAAGS